MTQDEMIAKAEEILSVKLPASTLMVLAGVLKDVIEETQDEEAQQCLIYLHNVIMQSIDVKYFQHKEWLIKNHNDVAQEVGTRVFLRISEELAEFNAIAALQDKK